MFLAVLSLLAASVAWHPFHTSVAEAQWTADGNTLQVSLRLTPADLDLALSEFHGRRVDLEREPDELQEQLLSEYLRDAIYLSSSLKDSKSTEVDVKKERRERFKWVGVQDEVRYVWVYFELKRMPVGTDVAADVWLTNRVMFEAEPTQINTLQLMRTDKPVAVRTTKSEPTKELQVVPSRPQEPKAS